VSGVDFDLGGSFSMEQTLTEEDFAVAGNSKTSIMPDTVVKRTVSTTSSLPLPLALQAMYRCQMGSVVPSVDRHKPQFVMKGGSFDILLCVDNTAWPEDSQGGDCQAPPAVWNLV